MTLFYKPIGTHMRPNVPKRTDGDALASTMTKREHFAALALQGLLADPNLYIQASTANNAVKAADLLIAALNGESITPPKPVCEPNPDWPED